MQIMSDVGTIDSIVCVVAGLLIVAHAIAIGFPQRGWNWVGGIGLVPLPAAASTFPA
jgi:hypothetical protein